MTYTESDCLDALQKATAELGTSPSQRKYRTLGFSPSPETIQRICGSWNDAKRQAGLVVNNGPAKSVNADFFKTIDTEEKSYWLGFLYGDGSVYQRSSGWRMSLGLAEQDKHHLEKFKSAINSDHTLSHRLGQEGNQQDSYEIKIGVQAFIENLRSHGLDDNKTRSSTVPDIEDDLLRAAFVRGLYDADGYWNTNGHNNYWNISSSSEARLNMLSSWLPVKSGVHENTERGFDTYYLLVSGSDNIILLSDWLYPDGNDTKPALHRKMKHASDLF